MTAAVAPSPNPGPSRLRRELTDLLASMRFAIALLTVICITSAIGTVVKQGEPMVNYVDQFGPFWAEVFGALGLYRVYSTGWFLTILAFLVTSTSLCIARNAPKILVDWRTHKENIRAQALQSFHHRASGTLGDTFDASLSRVLALLAQQGWSVKTQKREASAGGEAGVMIAARLGAVNKLGYIAAHSAIVLVCLGGLFDGDLIIKAQMWFDDLQPFKGGPEAPNSRLSVANPAYRAQLFVPEGMRTNAAVVNLEKGMLVQPLPFEVELKKFTVDYYNTGMPKRFASDVVIHDPVSKKDTPFTVEVNHPINYGGVTIFQSGFEDGGSTVHLQVHSLLGSSDEPLPLVDGMVGGQSRPLGTMRRPDGGVDTLQLEVVNLRVINVENMAATSRGKEGADAASGNDVRGVNLAELSKHLGSGAKGPGDKKLVNVGPSVTYKLRDSAGQAREFQNYMAPVTVDGRAVFLMGARETPAEGFRYLRIPADENMSLDGWMRLRHALNDPALRELAAKRFAQAEAPADRPEVQEQLTVSSQRALDLFAGAIPMKTADGRTSTAGGLQALSDFIEQVVPVDQREHASTTLVRILNGAMLELWNVSRERAGLKPLTAEVESARNFITQAVLSISDAAFYPAPMILTLQTFEQRQASVFQVTRTPGRNVVYLGCVLLIVGVFAMLYIRERRLWVWLQDEGAQGTRLSMAMSSTRHTLDTDREFDRLRDAVLGSPAPQAPGSLAKDA
jgi:cytochrome c biogenesis protein